MLFSWINSRRRRDRVAYNGCTIIIPLVDDTTGVIRTLNSILRQDYKEIEVIIAINGPHAIYLKSRIIDELEAVCLNADIRVLAIKRKNKANAINKALKKAKHNWYCIIDSDCTLKNKLSLSRMMIHTRAGVVAVGGRICISNPEGILGRFQKIEYNRTFMCLRNAMYRAKAVTIISGAYGVFNRSIVLKAGGYTTKHVGEDMDITLRLQRYCKEKHIPCCVEYEMRATINTKVPLNLSKLFRQRDRWQRGMIGSFLGNVTFRKDKRFAMRYIAQPYMLIFEMMAPLVFAMGTGRFVYQIATRSFSSDDFVFGIGFLVLYMIIEAFIDVIVETRRCRVDREKFDMKYVLYAMIMQVPMLGLQSFLMVAKLYGTITYPVRKRVW